MATRSSAEEPKKARVKVRVKTKAKKKSAQERATEALAKVKSDVNPAESAKEVDPSQVADPHLRDLYRMRTKLRSMMKKAEKGIEEAEAMNQRDAYTVLQFYRDYREVIAEIRSIEDQNEFAGIVYERVIKPYSDQLFQNFMDTLFLLRAAAQRELGPRYEVLSAHLESMTREHGRYMSQARDETLGKLEAIFTAQ